MSDVYFQEELALDHEPSLNHWAHLIAEDEMENGGTKYNVVLMVPWAVDKSAAGSQTDWDVIWTGFSPTVQDYSETMEYYLSKGEEIDSIYNGMRSFNTRSMAMGRTIFQGTAPSGKTGVALFRTCSLNKNKTLENAESAMIGMASALKKETSKPKT